MKLFATKGPNGQGRSDYAVFYFNPEKIIALFFNDLLPGTNIILDGGVEIKSFSSPDDIIAALDDYGVLTDKIRYV